MDTGEQPHFTTINQLRAKHLGPCGTPKPKAQRNFTDPDSRIMVRNGAYIQAYNAQLAVDEEHQIIVAAVSNQAPDAEYFEPMLRRVVHNCDAVPERTTADSSRCERSSRPNVAGRRTPDEKPPSSRFLARSALHDASCSFRLRLLKNRCEWLLVCTTHNVLKFWRALRGQRSAAAAAAAWP